MMVLMRTTLTIEPDVELLLQNEVRRTNKTMKTVVNEALRLGLGTKEPLNKSRSPSAPLFAGGDGVAAMGR